jgi:small subunit ribosomal protein S9
VTLTPVKLWTGRRKESVARVRLTPGDGAFTINGRTIDDYFPTRVHRMVAVAPLRLVGREKDYDVVASIRAAGRVGRRGP